MRKNNITEIDGHGHFTGPHSLHVDLREGGSRLVSFDHAVVATGSRVRMLPGVALSDNIVTYEQQILSAELPESIVIIGGGAIGMEFAYILHSYGVGVEILEFSDRVLPNEDADVSRELAAPLPAPRDNDSHVDPRGQRHRPRRARHRRPHRR